MTCNATNKCTHICTGGNCAAMCNSDSCSQLCPGGGCNMSCNGESCEQFCTLGGCSMDCQGQRCEQACTLGDCQLVCPRETPSCRQRCTTNKDKCQVDYLVPAITAAPTIPISVAPSECDRIEKGVCYQYCTGGGCTMKCNESPHYDSCDQSCTGG